MSGGSRYSIESSSRGVTDGVPGRNTLNGSQTGRNSSAHSGVTVA